MSLAESFGKSGVARFINSPTGRVVRIAIGLALVGYGFTQRATSTGPILMAVGAIPLIAGAFNLCLISALLGGPISGARINSGDPR